MKRLLLLTSLFICCFKTSHSQPGTPDASFGKKGIVTADLGSPYNYSLQGEKVLLLENGSFYAIHKGETSITKRRANGSIDSVYGNNGFSTITPFSTYDAALQADGKIILLDEDSFKIARYSTSGKLDASFARQGITPATEFDGTAKPNSLTVQADGKIVVAGYITDLYDNYFFAIARYNADGTLDKSFSNGGKAITSFKLAQPPDRGGEYPEIDFGRSVAIQSDGKILVVGSAFNYSSNSNEFAIARYNSDGKPDNTFDRDGMQTTDFGSDDQAYSVSLQKDGKIVVVGFTSQNEAYNFAIARYNINGSLDNTFDRDGKQTTSVGAIDFLCNMVAIQADGKIVVAGHAWNGTNNDFAINRLNLNGSLDNTFSGDGKVITDFTAGDDYAKSLKIQKDGKLLLIGYSYTASNFNLNSVLARYNTNGTLDNTFDGNGKLTESIKQGSTFYSRTAIQKDGKVVVAGYTWNGKNYDFVISRYNKTGSLDNTFNHKGVQTTDLGADEYAPSISIQNDGKIIIAGTTIRDDNSKVAVLRYNIDGSIDSTFSRDGKQSNNFGFPAAGTNAIATQNDGKILISCSVADNDFNAGFLIARLNTNGSLDNTFNNKGIRIMTGGQSFFIGNSLAIQRDGKIVVAGYNVEDLEVIRLNANGSLDKTFAGDGIQTTDFGFSDEVASSIAMQSDGKLIVAGGRRGSESGVLLTRYNINGSLDKTFSSDGKQFSNFGETYTYANSVAIQSNGKIIAAGGTTVARYNNDGSLDKAFSKNGLIKSPLSSIQNILIAGNKLYAAGSVLLPGSLGFVARYLLDENRAPTVNITDPTNNAVFSASATIPIKAIAADADGSIHSVKFYEGETYLKTVFASPYTYSLSHLAPGKYVITAKATDNKGAETISAPVTVTVKVPNKPPVVNITSPVNNSNYATTATIPLKASASDGDGRIIKVEFYNGTTLLRTERKPPYTYQWENVPEGQYSITAVATDNYGYRTTSSSIKIAVTSNTITANKSLFAENDKTAPNNALNFKIYPNPATRIVNISPNGLQTSKQTVVTVISAAGAVIKTMGIKSFDQTVQLDVSALTSGVYTIKLRHGDKALSKHLVKL